MLANVPLMQYNYLYSSVILVSVVLYTSGIYTTSQAIEQLRFFKTNNQISFHTEKALACLKYLETKEV